LNRRQFLLLHKRSNHLSDRIFQILSRNLLAVSGDAAQLIFTTRGQHRQSNFTDAMHQRACLLLQQLPNGIIRPASFWVVQFLPALVRTYNAGLSFALLLLLLFLGSQSLLKILHFCPISPCIQQPCTAGLPGSLARQPCPAALPGSLARQPCPAALPGSLARQPCPAVQPISTGFDARARLLRSHHTVLQWQVTKLHARAAVQTGFNLFLVQFYHAFIICMRALLLSRRVQTCSVVLL
jgi:hypothetical protein